MDWNQQALSLWNEGRGNEAVTALFKAIEQQPNDPDSYYNLIQLLIAGDKFADAAGVLETAQEKFPRNVSFIFTKGNWHYEQQQFSEALACYEDVFQRKEHTLAGEATVMLGQCYLALKQPKLALVYLLEAEVLFPGEENIWLMMGDALLQTGSFSDAGRYFNKVIIADETNAEAWFKKGLTKRTLNHDPDGVNECFRKARELDEELFLSFVKQIKNIDDELKNELN